MLLLDEHSPRIPAAKRRLMVWPLQPRSSTEAFCLKSSHVHICSTPVFKRALLFRTCPLDVDTLEGVSCPTLPYPGGSWPGQAHPYLPYPQA